MDQRKNIFHIIGDWWERRSERECASLTRTENVWLPSRGNVIFTLLMIGLLLWAQTAGAVPLGLSNAATNAATGTIAYQGRLADADGTPVTATVNMIFRLYNQATGGTPLWEEQWTGSNAVQVSDGLFNVMLGSLTPIPQSVITGNGSLFLGITVGTDDEMSPRVQLGNVPWAVQALTVPDGSITTEKIADGAVTKAKLAGDISSVQIQSGVVKASYVASPGWNLNQGIGPRSYTIHVSFPTPFPSTPSVNVSLKALDVGNAHNTRVNVYADKVTAEGFDLRIYTWGDTILYAVETTWLAYLQQ